jgi:MFS family permease
LISVRSVLRDRLAQRTRLQEIKIMAFVGSARASSYEAVESAAAEPLRRAVTFGFLCFAAAYFISYLFRNINAAIAGKLVADLSLDPAQLGLLTATYFLLFAAAQIPVGLLIDRFGSRRVVGTMLILSVAGAAAFAVSSSFAVLVVARALIGLGVAGAFMGGLKALLLWYPKERLPLVNGWLVAFGGFGAVAATLPAEFVLDHFGWRGVFGILAAATAVVAAAIFCMVPRQRGDDARVAAPAVASGLWAVLRSGRFWRLAPLSAAWIGSLWAFQGLWAERWFADVDHLDHQATMVHLLVMAVVFAVVAPCLGKTAQVVRRRWRIPSDVMLAILVAALAPAELTLALRWPLLSWAIPTVMAAASSATSLSFSALADYFPRNIAGTANGVLNTLHIGTAFAMQSLIGVIVARWAPDLLGRYPVVAYETAFGSMVVLQAGALLWFVLCPMGRAAPAALGGECQPAVAGALK